MKNIFVYYLAIGLPLLFLALGSYYSIINSYTFTILLLIYITIYRAIVDIERLIVKGLITKSNRYKLLNSFSYRRKYFKELYFKK